jgi:hypothetical protein
MNIFIGVAMVVGVLVSILWLDSELNKNDDFQEVKDWHNFQTKMGRK